MLVFQWSKWKERWEEKTLFEIDSNLLEIAMGRFEVIARGRSALCNRWDRN